MCVCRCSHCQTEKRCIAQLMAPLIAMLHEAADWVVEAGEDYIQDVPVGVPSSWEWLTVQFSHARGSVQAAAPLRRRR